MLDVYFHFFPRKLYKIIHLSIHALLCLVNKIVCKFIYFSCQKRHRILKFYRRVKRNAQEEDSWQERSFKEQENCPDYINVLFYKRRKKVRLILKKANNNRKAFLLKKILLFLRLWMLSWFHSRHGIIHLSLNFEIIIIIIITFTKDIEWR